MPAAPGPAAWPWSCARRRPAQAPVSVLAAHGVARACRAPRSLGAARDRPRAPLARARHGPGSAPSARPRRERPNPQPRMRGAQAEQFRHAPFSPVRFIPAQIQISPAQLVLRKSIRASPSPSNLIQPPSDPFPITYSSPTPSSPSNHFQTLPPLAPHLHPLRPPQPPHHPRPHRPLCPPSCPSHPRHAYHLPNPQLPSSSPSSSSPSSSPPLPHPPSCSQLIIFILRRPQPHPPSSSFPSSSASSS